MVPAFLGKTISEEQLSMLKEHLRLENFAKNDSVNSKIAKKVWQFESRFPFYPLRFSTIKYC